MKKKPHIAYFLFVISMIMLVIPVIPHHHHADGLICMKNDVTKDCCEHHHNAESKHCCCDTGCITTQFVQQTPSSDNGVQPDLSWVVILFSEQLYRLLLPEDIIKNQDSTFLESLHGTFITRATGLRAPPSTLA